MIFGSPDWGTSVSTGLAMQLTGRLLGVHLVPSLAAPNRAADDLTENERAALVDHGPTSATGSGFSAMHGTSPQTIGYSLLDSPVGLCAWIVEKLWLWTDHDGDLDQVLTRDQVLDDASSDTDTILQPPAERLGTMALCRGHC